MKKLTLLFLIFSMHSSYAQSTDEKAILKILDDQTKYWNQGNLRSIR